MFAHLKVIELASVLAGPAVGLFFAELGAQVIKIEQSKSKGDPTRKWKLPQEDELNESSAYFASVNWNKTYVQLNLKQTDALHHFYELVKTADVIICNWKMGDDSRLKVDYPRLKKLNPKLIYAQITGFGNLSSRVGYDVVLQAETAWMCMNGNSAELPTKLPVAIIDLFAAHQLKEGILCALLQLAKTGKGSKVTVSLFDAAVASLANQASNWLMVNHIPQPIGSLHPTIAPYGEILTFTSGLKIVLAIGTDQQFIALCNLLNLQHICELIRFQTNQNRVKNREELSNILQQCIGDFNAQEFVENCIHLNIPVGLVRNMQQLFELEDAKKLVMEDAIGKRVKTVVFKICD